MTLTEIAEILAGNCKRYDEIFYDVRNNDNNVCHKSCPFNGDCDEITVEKWKNEIKYMIYDNEYYDN